MRAVSDDYVAFQPYSNYRFRPAYTIVGHAFTPGWGRDFQRGTLSVHSLVIHSTVPFRKEAQASGAIFEPGLIFCEDERWIRLGRIVRLGRFDVRLAILKFAATISAIHQIHVFGDGDYRFEVGAIDSKVGKKVVTSARRHAWLSFYMRKDTIYDIRVELTGDNPDRLPSLLLCLPPVRYN